MRVLVLDDDETRLKQFRQNLIGHVVECVKTAREAISKLESEKWDCFFTDHDLGGKIFVPSGPGTGYEVAQWLEQNPDKQPKEIYIHSFNAVGAKNIQAVLPNAVIVPGAWAQIKMED
jgi:CheY-like chemotaxis protein